MQLKRCHRRLDIAIFCFFGEGDTVSETSSDAGLDGEYNTKCVSSVEYPWLMANEALLS